ncbi:fibronectin type III-like domain-contianing protein [Streptomyces sp. B21-097]|uniref:fibronectin type III-like domain-contianing protein n=1 Tax=Streptomyces sp. B21-097 TaxID=3039414 RepID=UPI002FEF8BF1
MVVSRDMAHGLTIHVTVRNSGARPGREVVQVYLEPADGSEPPNLVGFSTVEAGPIEAVIAAVTVPARALATWTGEGRAARTGGHRLPVGRSSADIRLTAAVPRPS